MSLVEIPIHTADLSEPQLQRMEAFAIAAQLGLLERFENYRLAVQAGFFSDYPQEAR